MFSPLDEVVPTSEINGFLELAQNLKEVALGFLLIAGIVGIGWTIFRRTTRDINTAEFVRDLVLNSVLIIAVFFLATLENKDQILEIIREIDALFV